MSITVRVEGAEELADKLETMPNRIQRKVMRRALRQAAKPIMDKAKTLCPILEHERKNRQVGALRDSIKVRAGKRRKSNISVVIGSSADWYTGDQYYGAFIEFGHYQGKPQHRGKKYRGEAQGRTWIEAKPYMRPAYESGKSAALNNIIGNVKVFIEEETGKGNLDSGVE